MWNKWFKFSFHFFEMHFKIKIKRFFLTIFVWLPRNKPTKQRYTGPTSTNTTKSSTTGRRRRTPFSSRGSEAQRFWFIFIKRSYLYVLFTCSGSGSYLSNIHIFFSHASCTFFDHVDVGVQLVYLFWTPPTYFDCMLQLITATMYWTTHMICVIGSYFVKCLHWFSSSCNLLLFWIL